MEILFLLFFFIFIIVGIMGSVNRGSNLKRDFDPHMTNQSFHHNGTDMNFNGIPDNMEIPNQDMNFNGIPDYMENNSNNFDSANNIDSGNSGMF